MMQTLASCKLAVIDLGSNSFRLELAKPLANGDFKRLVYYKQTVRLGAALDAAGYLQADAMAAALDCLHDFAVVLRRNPSAKLAVIATQTLREAKNAADFLQQAESILGCPVQVISGAEEARLVYVGVSARLQKPDEQRLIIDIGGRSTELSIGHGLRFEQGQSHALGSVACSQKFFQSGEFSSASLQTAFDWACQVLAPAQTWGRSQLWSIAYGSAGTTSAVSLILKEAGYPEDRVNRSGLEWLTHQLLRAGHIDALQLPGLLPDRRPVIGGGLSVLRAVFEVLNLQELHIVSGALRHGVMQELLLAEG